VLLGFCQVSATTSANIDTACLQHYKTEPVYRRKNEPPLAGCFLSLC
jgi:hypothetical protein